MADVRIRVRMDPSSLSTLAGMLPDASARAFSNMQASILAYAKSITPESTGWKHDKYGPRGALRDSIIVSPTPRSIHIIWRAPYADIADKGAIPHVIFAKTPRGLTFKNRFGQWVRTMSVDHPGYLGNYFSEEMRLVAPILVREAIENEMRGIVVP